MPYEEKQFVQYFMPYRDLGIVKQASKDFVMNIHEDGPLREAVLRDFADLDVVDFLVTTSDFAFFALEPERTVPEPLASA